MSNHQRSRPETSTFVDAATGYTIRQLTDSPMESKHAYYDISPWSPDGRTLAFSAAHPADLTIVHRDTLATDKGHIYLLDLETYALRLLTEKAFYNTHTGAFPVWHPTKLQLYCYLAPEQIGVFDATNGDLLRTMEGGIRQLSPDGELLTWTTNDIHTDLPRGVYTMREDGSARTLIVPTEALYELTPNRDLFHIDQMIVGNTKWTPDGRHMLVAMWIKATPDDLNPWNSPHRRSLYVVSRDGSERRWLTYFGHHHSWTADGGKVLYSGYVEHTDDGGRGTPRLFMINFDGSDNHVIIDHPLGGHPIANPAGTLITTWDDKGVILADLKQQTVHHIAILQPSFDQSHRGTHPHCIWSPDGSQILYNSAHTGPSQLYLIDLQ